MTEITIKLLLVGDSNVGKTSLLLKYTDDNYPLEHIATVGIEYRIKMFDYKNFKIKIQIWDTAGQERFHSITNNFFRNSNGILFVYDITKHESFEGVINWVKEAEDIGDDYQKILIGNKCDLDSEREVKEEEVEKFSNEKNIRYFETSAKNGTNLDEALSAIVELILKDKSDQDIIKEFGEKVSCLSVSTTKKKGRNIKNKNKKKSERCC